MQKLCKSPSSLKLADGTRALKKIVLISATPLSNRPADIRNSKVVDIYNELKSYGIQQIDVVDPYASSHEVFEEYGFSLKEQVDDKYDAIIVAVSHKDYISLDSEYFKSIAAKGCVFVDVKGIFRQLRDKFTYWSL